MHEIMKGNFKTKKKVTASDEKDNLNTQFEKEALRKLGGSIAFVSKKNFLYGVDKDKTSDQKPS